MTHHPKYVTLYRATVISGVSMTALKTRIADGRLKTKLLPFHRGGPGSENMSKGAREMVAVADLENLQVRKYGQRRAT